MIQGFGIAIGILTGLGGSLWVLKIIGVPWSLLAIGAMVASGIGYTIVSVQRSRPWTEGRAIRKAPSVLLALTIVLLAAMWFGLISLLGENNYVPALIILFAVLILSGRLVSLLYIGNGQRQNHDLPLSLPVAALLTGLLMTSAWYALLKGAFMSSALLTLITSSVATFALMTREKL